jgi:hypothetical protein
MNLLLPVRDAFASTGLAFLGSAGSVADYKPGPRPFAPFQRRMLSQLPSPVSAMWLEGGSNAYVAEMALIRGGSA